MPDGLDRDAGVFRASRARGDDDFFGPPLLDLPQAQAVVSDDAAEKAELRHDLVQIVGEGIVVVDEQNHGADSTARRTALSLLSTSAYSRRGAESATMPAPACMLATPL